MSCQDKSIGQSELERFRFVNTIVLIEIVLSDMNSVSLKLFQLFRVFLDSKSKVRTGRSLSIDKNFFVQQILTAMYSTILKVLLTGFSMDRST